MTIKMAEDQICISEIDIDAKLTNYAWDLSSL